MRNIAAYLLLQLGGNAKPSASDIKGLFASVGIDSDDARIDKLLSELEGKDVHALIAEGSTKLASVPSGGGGGGGVAAAAGGAAGGATEAPKAEEKKEEEKEESDDDMGFGLFD